MSQELMTLLSENKKHKLTQYLMTHPEEINLAIHIALTSQQPQAWRASWVTAQLMTDHDARVLPLVDQLIADLDNKPDGHQRELLKIIQKIQLTAEQEGKIFDPAGGTIDGFIAAQETILALADSSTKIIPGHGSLSSEKEVEELLGMLTQTREIIYDLKTAGRTLDEVLTVKPLDAYHERWSGSFINSDLFTRIIYETLP